MYFFSNRRIISCEGFPKFSAFALYFKSEYFRQTFLMESVSKQYNTFTLNVEHLQKEKAIVFLILYIGHHTIRHMFTQLVQTSPVPHSKVHSAGFDGEYNEIHG